MKLEHILSSVSEAPDIFEKLQTLFDQVQASPEIEDERQLASMRFLYESGGALSRPRGSTLRLNLIESHLRFTSEYSLNQEEDFFV